MTPEATSPENRLTLGELESFTDQIYHALGLAEDLARFERRQTPQGNLEIANPENQRGYIFVGPSKDYAGHCRAEVLRLMSRGLRVSEFDFDETHRKAILYWEGPKAEAA